MKRVSLFTLFTLLVSGVASRDRPVRGHVDLQHIGEGVQFKIGRNKDRQGLRGETEHVRVARIANAVAKAVEHLTGGLKPARVFRHSGANEEKQAEAGLHLWYRFDVAKRLEGEHEFAAQQRALDAVAHLTDKQHPLALELEKVETELKYRALYSTNDPKLSEQVTSHYGIINLEDAWEFTAGSSDVVVQVIDTGIDMDHPDLLVNQWINSGETDCDDGIDNDGNGFIDDCRGYNHAENTGTELEGDGSHGTHCAGTIAADNDNGVGVAGIAGGKGGNAGASLMISTVFGATTTSGFAEALVYGADNGAHISSNSWGYTTAGVYDSSVLDAMDYADAAGVMIVFAAGNDGTNEDWYPAYYEPAIAVAAVDANKEAAYFTNYGDWVDISAPGYPVLSTVTVADGSYDWMSGTSMACPHVAGGLALAKSYLPTATSEEIVACLFSSAEEIDSLNTNFYSGGLGTGLMDLPALFQCLGEAPSQTPTISPAPTYPVTPSPTAMPIVCGDCSMTLTLTVTTDQYPTESSYKLEAADSTPCFDDVTGPGSAFTGSSTHTVVISDALCEYSEYDFTFYDSFGDGICCTYGQGSFSLDLDGRTVYESDGDFGSSTTYTISTAPVPAPTQAPVQSPTIAPLSVSTCDDLGWTNAAAYGDDDVCGNSKKPNNKCIGKKNFNQALNYCEGIGARLCTDTEIKNDEARGTGCSLDAKHVWSKTQCASGSGHLGSRSGATSKCYSDSKKVPIRCCADAISGPPVPAPTKAPTPSDPPSTSSCDDLGWTNAAVYGESEVCGNSVNGANKCSGKKKFDAANNWCEGIGARLCTLDELLNDEARGTGCSLDGKKVWSSTECGTNKYYVASGSTTKTLTQCKGKNTGNIKVRCCADV